MINSNKISLVWYLFRSYFGLISLTLIIVLSLSFKLIYDNSVKTTQTHLISQAVLLEELLLNKMPSLTTNQLYLYLSQISNSLNARFTLINLEGDVLFDSMFQDKLFDNHSNRPEIKEALSLGKGFSKRYSNSYGDTFIYYAVRLKVPNYFDGVLRVSVPIVVMQSSLGLVLRDVLLGAIITIAFAGLLAFSFSKQFTRLIKDINRMAVAFSRKEPSQRLPIAHSREMEKLVASVMKMGDFLHNRIDRVSRIKNEQALLLENMIESVIMIDHHHNVTIMNSAACQLFDVNSETVAGVSIFEFVSNNEIKQFILDTVDANEVLERECELQIDPIQVLLMHGVPLKTGQDLRGYLFVAQDISKIKQLERVRKDFVANVSHELKTPITLIKGAVETLLQGAMNDPKYRDQFLSIILRHSDRLAAIIDDLLQLSKLEGGLEQYLMDYEMNDVQDIIDSVITTSSESAYKKNVKIECVSSIDIEIPCNRSLIHQGLSNLVDNAVKYSPEGEQVTVELKTSNQHVLIYVKDVAGGIPQEHHSKLFQRFYRVDKSRSRDMGGTGLGLSIVKHIVTAHGGELGVFSIPNGSCFWMELPISGNPNMTQQDLF